MAALLSPRCVVCEAVAARVASGAVCDACWQSVRFITPPFCFRCGDPLSVGPNVSSADPFPCTCPQLPADVHIARALGSYEGTLRLAIHALKYQSHRSVAPKLARLIVERYDPVLAGADAIVPVPLHRRRRWRRGFNQCEEIAGHLPLPVWRVLRRVRHTPPQTGLTAAERRMNVQRAFAPRRVGRPSRVAGRCIVLLDDVSTTGATLAACAAVLKRLGAREIRGLTIARTRQSSS